MADEYSAEELDILDAIESGRTASIPNLDDEQQRYGMMAAASLRKDKRVNIASANTTSWRSSARPSKKGFYQTLISACCICTSTIVSSRADDLSLYRRHRESDRAGHIPKTWLLASMEPLIFFAGHRRQSGFRHRRPHRPGHPRLAGARQRLRTSGRSG